MKITRNLASKTFGTGAAVLGYMQLLHGLTRPTIFFRSANAPKRSKITKTIDRYTSKYVVDEINAYIAVRDTLLAEAEDVMTDAKLRSAMVANEYVETCLKPARPPYESQHLSEADAVRERQRCAAVNARLAELRTRIAQDQDNCSGALSRCA